MANVKKSIAIRVWKSDEKPFCVRGIGRWSVLLEDSQRSPFLLGCILNVEEEVTTDGGHDDARE